MPQYWLIHTNGIGSKVVWEEFEAESDARAMTRLYEDTSAIGPGLSLIEVRRVDVSRGAKEGERG